MICQERTVQDETCGGPVTVDRDGDWLVYRCGTCGMEAAKHAQTADPEQKRQLRLQQAGLPDRFLGLVFDESEENKSALFALRGWLADFRKGDPMPAPALFGRAGRGKSHLLTGLCVRLIRDCDAAVLFRSVRGLLRELQRFDDDVQRGESWRRAATVPVLALDDLGAQQVTDWKHDQIADLVDVRYEAELPILLASNFPPSQWPTVMDARTASRLRGMTFAVELKGPDRRQQVLETTQGEA